MYIIMVYGFSPARVWLAAAGTAENSIDIADIKKSTHI